MTEDSLFREQLDQIGMRNKGPKLAFSDLFTKGTTRLSTDIELARYISSARRNWDNYEPDDNIAAGVKENDDRDIGRSPLNNPYELYSIYN